MTLGILAVVVLGLSISNIMVVLIILPLIVNFSSLSILLFLLSLPLLS